MKTIALLLGALSGIANLALAEPLTMEWSAISGGGGMTSDGRFAVAGHVGSAAPGTSIDGARFIIEAGFWVASVLVQSIGLPELRIELFGSSAVLIWPLATEYVVLEESTDLLPGAWSAVGMVPEIVGAERRLTFPLQPGRRFFRLRKFAE